MGEPDALIEPITGRHVIDGATTKLRKTKGIFIFGFTQMSVQEHVVTMGQRCGIAHELLSDRERRTRRKGNLTHRMRCWVVPLLYEPLTVREYCLRILHHLIWRQPASAFPQTHRTPRQHHTHPDTLCRLGLAIDGMGQCVGEYVVMIDRGSAS